MRFGSFDDHLEEFFGRLSVEVAGSERVMTLRQFVGAHRVVIGIDEIEEGFARDADRRGNGGIVVIDGGARGDDLSNGDPFLGVERCGFDHNPPDERMCDQDKPFLIVRREFPDPFGQFIDKLIGERN